MLITVTLEVTLYVYSYINIIHYLATLFNGFEAKFSNIRLATDPKIAVMRLIFSPQASICPHHQSIRHQASEPLPCAQLACPFSLGLHEYAHLSGKSEIVN